MSKLKEEYGFSDDLDEYGIEDQSTGKNQFNTTSKKLNLGE